MDRILITDLSVRCIIGIDEKERLEKQDVLINLSIFANLHRAADNDSFDDAVDYRSIKKQVYSFVENSGFFLAEALAEAIAAICLEYPGVLKVKVRVDKPSALRFAKSVGVEIERMREVV
jgi:FolB domain-containing protein